MGDLSQGQWLLVAIVLVAAIAALLWLYAANRKTRIESEDRDEAAPARRNQALIDSPPASARHEAAPAAAPAAEPVATPAPVPAPSPSPSPTAETVDDLSLIKGLGPKLRSQLAEMGIVSFAQIAAWDEADIDRVDAQLGRFQGRIRRDDWVGQARLLAAGDIAAYEDRFGKT